LVPIAAVAAKILRKSSQPKMATGGHSEKAEVARDVVEELWLLEEPELLALEAKSPGSESPP